MRSTVLLSLFLGVCVLLGRAVDPAGAAQEPQAATSTRIDRELPERLADQVAPSPSTLWRTPDLRGYTNGLKAIERSPIDPQKRYDLLELIDLAQRLNPETRVAWERARQAAIGVGLVESEYFPMLALSALGGTRVRRSRRPRMSPRAASSAPIWHKSCLR